MIVINLPCGFETLWLSGFHFSCSEVDPHARLFTLGFPKPKETVLEVGRDPDVISLSLPLWYYSSLRLTLSWSVRTSTPVIPSMSWPPAYQVFLPSGRAQTLQTEVSGSGLSSTPHSFLWAPPVHLPWPLSLWRRMGEWSTMGIFYWLSFLVHFWVKPFLCASATWCFSICLHLYLPKKWLSSRWPLHRTFSIIPMYR